MTGQRISRALVPATAMVLLHCAYAESADPIRFNRDIRPILSDKCFACHGPDAAHREADLRLDLESGATMDLGDDRRAVVPGRPDASELIDRIASKDPDVRMPPGDSGKELTEGEIRLLRQWIQQGAPYERHWSYAPLKRPPVPDVGGSDWPVNDIDRFILARLQAAGLAPSPQADSATLARRIHFDLIGLPPEAAQIEGFLNGPTDASYESMVARRLDSKHYGERMAMYWLDLVRYADTVGYHGDQDHPISPYRDWVIKAFNDNMPFDRFTLEQIAGDLLPEPTESQRIATGYNRLLQTSHEGGVQQKEYLAKYAADRVRNISQVWMGATMGCAECHDHKYDPYTQKDFYSLAAFFADVDDYQSFKGSNTLPTKREPELVVLSPLDRERLSDLESELSRFAAAQRKAQTNDKPLPPDNPESAAENRVARLNEQIRQLKSQTRRTMITASIEPRVMRVLNRGDWMDDSGPVVEPAIPEFLGAVDSGGGRATRLDLAHWLTSNEQPQTARVFVNRLWYLFIGAGLSGDVGDTGSQGQWPSHPDLLEWLAREFIDSGWDVKHMIRLIVTSRTYRQSSLVPADLSSSDPSNKLFARQNRFRLPAEMIRDQALAVSGLLVDRLGGVPARPYQPAGYFAHLNFPTRKYTADADSNQYRRGVYVHWQRQFLHPMFRAFDAPTREECTVQRPISNTPSAALTLLNDPTFVEAAKAFAIRIMKLDADAPTQRIQRAWRRALTRRATRQEVEALDQLYRASLATYRSRPQQADELLKAGLSNAPDGVDHIELAAWTTVARAMLNLSETITRN